VSINQVEGKMSIGNFSTFLSYKSEISNTFLQAYTITIPYARLNLNWRETNPSLHIHESTHRAVLQRLMALHIRRANVGISSAHAVKDFGDLPLLLEISL
jgi:hypothetical protein